MQLVPETLFEKKNLDKVSPQLDLQLDYWDTAFFTPRIQILSFSGKSIFNRKWLSDLPIKEKTLVLNPGQCNLLGVLFLLFEGVWPTPDKTAMKAENHSKEGPINTNVAKFVFITSFLSTYFPKGHNFCPYVRMAHQARIQFQS